MGNKKKSNQSHVQQSMGQMVSKAALAQLAPQIERYVAQNIQQLGSQLAVKQSETIDILFSRIINLESIIIDKLGYTKESLALNLANLEDAREGLAQAEAIQQDDVVRLEIKTKTKDQSEFQGSSRMKLYKTGSGETLGPIVESALIGMVAGESKEIEIEQEQQLTVQVLINRISRGVKNETQVEG